MEFGKSRMMLPFIENVTLVQSAVQAEFHQRTALLSLVAVKWVQFNALSWHGLRVNTNVQ